MYNNAFPADVEAAQETPPLRRQHPGSSNVTTRFFDILRNAFSGHEGLDENVPGMDPVPEILPPGFRQNTQEHPRRNPTVESANDTFILSVKLSLNGKVLQSLSLKDADLTFGSPESYFMFNKVTGKVYS